MAKSTDKEVKELKKKVTAEKETKDEEKAALEKENIKLKRRLEEKERE